jgi:hypothetical protein
VLHAPWPFKVWHIDFILVIVMMVMMMVVMVLRRSYAQS